MNLLFLTRKRSCLAWRKASDQLSVYTASSPGSHVLVAPLWIKAEARTVSWGKMELADPGP